MYDYVIVDVIALGFNLTPLESTGFGISPNLSSVLGHSYTRGLHKTFLISGIIHAFVGGPEYCLPLRNNHQPWCFHLPLFKTHTPAPPTPATASARSGWDRVTSAECTQHTGHMGQELDLFSMRHISCQLCTWNWGFFVGGWVDGCGSMW